jgi:hypothetical protein
LSPPQNRAIMVEAMTVAESQNALISPAQLLYLEYFSDKIFVSNILAGSCAATPRQSIDSRDFTNSIRIFFLLQIKPPQALPESIANHLS